MWQQGKDWRVPQARGDGGGDGAAREEFRGTCKCNNPADKVPSTGTSGESVGYFKFLI